MKNGVFSCTYSIPQNADKVSIFKAFKHFCLSMSIHYLGFVREKCLERLLNEYNDGRKKTLFCLAVNLMPINDLMTAFVDEDMDLPIKDRARLMEKRLKEKSAIELKLRKKK